VFSDTLPPGAPTIGNVSVGNASATVRWTAPATGAVDGYTVKVTDAAGTELFTQQVANPGASSAVVRNLVNGDSYRFAVRAFNAAGAGEYSALSAQVTPTATVPAAPTVGVADAGNGRATVHWTAPADTGGAPLVRYEVQVLDIANQQVGALWTAGPTATQLTVTGLTNGEQYWFKVRAVNTVGKSPYSLREATTTPGTLPSAARIGTANALDSAATVRWLAPRNSGGLGISQYVVRVVGPAGEQVGGLRAANAAATSARVAGLTNGVRYRFQVAAVNEMGQGAFSSLSNGVVPGTRPDAPLIRRAASGAFGGRVTATARWAPPAGETLPAITGYVVTAMRMASRAIDARVLDRTRSSVVAPDSRRLSMRLEPGIYRFTVVARNSRGSSPASAPSQGVVAR
jgi:predicted phage tail protein